jgi:methylase of polypeptide subunit release factors
MVGQAPMVANLLEQQGNYAHIQIHADLSGIPRFVLAQRS